MVKHDFLLYHFFANFAVEKENSNRQGCKEHNQLNKRNKADYRRRVIKKMNSILPNVPVLLFSVTRAKSEASESAPFFLPSPVALSI